MAYLRGRVSVAHRCWPFTWRPITMAIPRPKSRAQVPCPELERVVCPPFPSLPPLPPPPPPRGYWCTTTRNRAIQTVWVSSRIRPLRRRLIRRWPSGLKKIITSNGDRWATRETTSCSYLTTPGQADGWRVSASRVTCTSSMTIPTNCFRFVYIWRPLVM